MNARTVGATLTIAMILTVTACNSSSKSSSSAKSSSAGTPTVSNSDTAATGAATTAPPAATAPAGTAAAATSIDVCTVLPAAKAAQLSGQPYTIAVPAAEGWTSGCAYNNDDSTAEGVNVNVDSGANAGQTWTAVDTGSVSNISGLGDKAFWDNDNTLYALAGSVLIQVNGLESEDKSEALAKVVLDAAR